MPQKKLTKDDVKKIISSLINKEEYAVAQKFIQALAEAEGKEMHPNQNKENEKVAKDIENAKDKVPPMYEGQKDVYKDFEKAPEQTDEEKRLLTLTKSNVKEIISSLRKAGENELAAKFQKSLNK